MRRRATSPPFAPPPPRRRALRYRRSPHTRVRTETSARPRRPRPAASFQSAAHCARATARRRARMPRSRATPPPPPGRSRERPTRGGQCGAGRERAQQRHRCGGEQPRAELERRKRSKRNTRPIGDPAEHAGTRRETAEEGHEHPGDGLDLAAGDQSHLARPRHLVDERRDPRGEGERARQVLRSLHGPQMGRTALPGSGRLPADTLRRPAFHWTFPAKHAADLLGPASPLRGLEWGPRIRRSATGRCTRVQ